MKLAMLISCAALAYNPESCPTVVVKGQDGGPLIINQSDYDATPDAWELYDDSTAAAPAPAPAAPVQMVVSKIGKTFFVTDMEKNKITDTAGIDAAGYADESAAWAAIMAATTANAANG